MYASKKGFPTWRNFFLCFSVYFSDELYFPIKKIKNLKLCRKFKIIKRCSFQGLLFEIDERYECLFFIIFSSFSSASVHGSQKLLHKVSGSGLSVEVICHTLFNQNYHAPRLFKNSEYSHSPVFELESRKSRTARFFTDQSVKKNSETKVQ